jgi:hypothetical protein
LVCTSHVGNDHNTNASIQTHEIDHPAQNHPQCWSS